MPRRHAQKQPIAAAPVVPAAARPRSPLQRAADASAAAQRLDALQRLAASRAPVQREAGLEEEELLQGRFVQRASLEEEEPLQGRFVQRMSLEEEEPLQGRFADPQPFQRAGGLPSQLQAGIESLSGLSMEDVRVHYGSSRPAQLEALAYAQGTDIHVAPGQEQHLPHEAWHVVQQAQGRVKPTTSVNGAAVNDDAALEHEADVMGARALSAGAEAAQRMEGPEEEELQLRRRPQPPIRGTTPSR